MDQIHGSNPWTGSMDLNRKLARIGFHILCVLGNYHIFLLATKTSFRRYACLESAHILRPWLNLANVKPAQSVGWRRPSGCQKQANYMKRSSKTGARDLETPAPRIRSMDQIHGSDPWIRSMDLIHGSEQKAGQNRLTYPLCAW